MFRVANDGPFKFRFHARRSRARSAAEIRRRCTSDTSAIRDKIGNPTILCIHFGVCVLSHYRPDWVEVAARLRQCCFAQASTMSTSHVLPMGIVPHTRLTVMRPSILNSPTSPQDRHVYRGIVRKEVLEGSRLSTCRFRSMTRQKRSKKRQSNGNAT